MWAGGGVAKDLLIGLAWGTVIGAGAVVMSDVPPGVTMIGNPAKVFRFK